MVTGWETLVELNVSFFSKFVSALGRPGGRFWMKLC